MKFQYFTDEEYERAFEEFGDSRKKIADLLASELEEIPTIIMDVPAGHAYLSAELARNFPQSQILAIGLPNDYVTHVYLRNSNAYSQDIWTRVQYLVSDATNLPLKSNSCDIVANFLGLEDVMMTRGVKGVDCFLSEISRIVTDTGLVEISIIEYGDSPEEKVAKEVWDTIGLNCVFLKPEWYLNKLREYGLEISNQMVFTFPKKMTVDQAKEELEFACENTPKTFLAFRVLAISFSKLWEQFGKRIEKYGMAYWSRIRVMVFSKF